MSDACTVSGCAKKAHARGLCITHYSRWRKGRDLSAPVRTPPGTVDAFIDAILKASPDKCVIWPFHRSRRGYAIQGTQNGRSGLVHRYLCEVVNGPPPSPAHQAAHICGNGLQGCVNPRHVEWKTPLENSADRYVHGTVPIGSDHPLAKITPSMAVDIRERRAGGEGATDIALSYGLNPSTVRDIATGKTWKHAGGPLTKPSRGQRHRAGTMAVEVCEDRLVSP